MHIRYTVRTGFAISTHGDPNDIYLSSALPRCVRVNAVGLSGTIPVELGMLTTLNTICLRNNKL